MKHPARNDLTAEYVRSLLNYDPETGMFRWKPRTPAMFGGGNGGHSPEHRCKCWNSRYAGAMAGTVSTALRQNVVHLTVRIEGRNYYAHRLAWLYVHGEWPDGDIDHINGDGLDNRIANLRVATRSQNCANVGRRAHNTSGVKGIYQHGMRWRASIRVKGKSKHLGCFGTPADAQAAYMAAAREHFGEFARGA